MMVFIVYFGAISFNDAKASDPAAAEDKATITQITCDGNYCIQRTFYLILNENQERIIVRIESEVFPDSEHRKER